MSLWLRGYLAACACCGAAAALAGLDPVCHAPSARADDAMRLKAALDTRLAYVDHRPSRSRRR